MEFFDKMRQTVSDTGRNAKDAADIAGLNNKISDNERQMKKLYEQLGKSYYKVHSKEPEQDFAETVNGITELQDEIDVWNDQIQQIRGYIKCPDCGEYVEKTETECPNCGHSFLPEGAVICPNCGAVISEPGVMFCQYCGASLDKQKESGPVDTLEPGSIKCKCGAILGKDDKFCPQCGTSREELEHSQNNQEGI